jgi:hypothetical protein
LVIRAEGAPSLDAVITQMLDRLLLVLPPPEDPLLPTAAQLVSVAERPLGLANRRGSETLGALGPISLKGGRLDAAVRFEVWGSQLVKADAAALALHGAVTGARDALRADGFLRTEGADFSAAEKDANTGSWRKTAAYRFLYEYQYLDADAAASLIVRIPAEADLEELGSPDRETTVITGGTVRWDDETAPVFGLRGPDSVAGLSVLTFVPGTAPTGAVTLLRTFDGAAGAPAAHPDLPTFLAAVAGPAPTERHARLTFPSLTDFLNALDPAVDSVELGDWDLNGVVDNYQIRPLTFAAAIGLPRFADRFEISYQTVLPATGFDHQAVLYLRAEH